MTSDSYKGPRRRSTQRRVDDRSQRFHPAQDPVHGFDDRIERECDRLGCSDPIGPCPGCPNAPKEKSA